MTDEEIRNDQKNIIKFNEPCPIDYFRFDIQPYPFQPDDPLMLVLIIDFWQQWRIGILKKSRKSKMINGH